MSGKFHSFIYLLLSTTYQPLMVFTEGEKGGGGLHHFNGWLCQSVSPTHTGQQCPGGRSDSAHGSRRQGGCGWHCRLPRRHRHSWQGLPGRVIFLPSVIIRPSCRQSGSFNPHAFSVSRNLVGPQVTCTILGSIILYTTITVSRSNFN